ncbi:MAG: DNA polymerase Y family protein [Gemmatimonadota bacterium]
MTGRVLVLWCPQLAGDGAFGQVVTAVEDFCPQVEVLRPGACAIGARGPARYFGGEEPLGRRIIAAVSALGTDCQAGVAGGLFTAELAARTAAPGGLQVVPASQEGAFLGPLPVSALGDPDLADVLPRLGIRTLADFAALPAAEAVNRFGTTGAVAHRLARGLPPRPLAPRPPAADLSAAIEFDPPAPGTEPVVFAAKALAEQMQAGLSARGLACVRVRVQVTGEHGQESSRLWRHDGLLSALAMAERVRWQLADWQAAQQPGPDSDGEGLPPAGITRLRLVPDQLVRAEGRQLGLWGDAVVSDRVTRAAMQVQAMLGHRAVTRPVLSGGRGPGEQATLTPFGDLAEPARAPGQPWPARIPLPAPATVFGEPLPARVTGEDGGEVTVTGRALVSAPPARLSADGGPSLAVTAWAGPWPVSERWWDPGTASRRARFQLVTADGTGWLAAVADGRWQLEARYD